MSFLTLCHSKRFCFFLQTGTRGRSKHQASVVTYHCSYCTEIKPNWRQFLQLQMVNFTSFQIIVNITKPHWDDAASSLSLCFSPHRCISGDTFLLFARQRSTAQISGPPVLNAYDRKCVLPLVATRTTSISWLITAQEGKNSSRRTMASIRISNLPGTGQRQMRRVKYMIKELWWDGKELNYSCVTINHCFQEAIIDGWGNKMPRHIFILCWVAVTAGGFQHLIILSRN